jgi:tetratricopeptide (TPR) repeat protein
VTVVVVVAFVALAAAVDPTSARAIARRNEELLDQGETALARGEGEAALARASAIDTDDRRLPRGRFFRLRGRARAAVGLLDDAVVDLRVARDEPGESAALVRTLTLELGRHERARGDFGACATEFATAHAALPVDDADAIVWATCLRATPDRAKAHDVLAHRRAAVVGELRARLWLEDGLPRLAREELVGLIDALDAPLLVAFARAFDDARDRAFARALLDAAVARHPDDETVLAAWAAIDDEVPDRSTRAARAALVHSGMATTLRSAGRANDAWRAILAADDDARLRERFALLVDARAWERVAGLAPRLRARGIVDDDVAYAVAWAHFARGRLDDAEVALNDVRSPAGFAQATELRAAIAQCRAALGSADEERRCPR